MPSKAKKQPKTTTPLPSKLSFSDDSPSLNSRTPSTPLQLTQGSEEDVFCALEEASRIFPALLTNSAFIGQVSNVGTDSKRCTVWLSEAAMVSSSLTPGSTVSVSLASLSTGVSENFPLRSFEAESSMNIGINSRDPMANQVGNYFALATVFPSCKVLKKGVSLSSSLSFSMGCPASGSYIFVNFIHNHALAGTIKENDKSLNAATLTSLSSYKCKELYLKLVPAINGSNIKQSMSSSIKYIEDTSDDHSRDQIFSTPRTQPYQSRLNSPNSGPSPSATARSEKSESRPLSSEKTSFDSVDVHEVLGDENAKKLLQTCATSWLKSRSLFYGNLVTIPILSKVCIFQVIGANRLLLDDSKHDCTGENGNKISSQAIKLVDHVDAFVVDGETKVYFYLPLSSALESLNTRSLPHLDLDCENVEAEGVTLKLGGLSKEYALLKDIIFSSSVKNTLSSLGLRPTKGVLLHGPPGTGKTSLARLCAHDAGVKVFSINGPEIVGQYLGESEKALQEVFDSASRSAPAVVFIDEVDAIAPARKDGGEEMSQRMVATLLNLMDGISSSDGIIIVAATNRLDCIEPALRRPGRLDREIEIGVPSPKQRLDILHTLISQMKSTISNEEIDGLAISTHGFVGADLAALCNEAALFCLRRYISKDTTAVFPENDPNSSSSSVCKGTTNNFAEIVPDGSCNNAREPCPLGEDPMLKVTIEDFDKARIKVKPSAMREVILEVPKVKWVDVGGQKEVKAQLREAVEWPQKYQDAFVRIGTTPPRGVLLFGPPGCSKTLMARAVASEAGLNFLAVKGPELFSKWVGESEKAVKALFAKARANAPSVIFFDEIDGLAITRGRESEGISVSDRVISQLLVEMDGLQERVNVTVIAATNRPDKIDPALLRPGRFDRLLYVGPPNESDREDIFRIHLREIPCGLDVSRKELAALTEGFTGADISLVCREGAVAALEESLDASEITMKHLKSAIELIQPSEIPSYKELSAKFQRLVHSDATKEKPNSSATQEEPNFQSVPNQTRRTDSVIEIICGWIRFW